MQSTNYSQKYDRRREPRRRKTAEVQKRPLSQKWRTNMVASVHDTPCASCTDCDSKRARQDAIWIIHMGYKADMEADWDSVMH